MERGCSLSWVALHLRSLHPQMPVGISVLRICDDRVTFRISVSIKRRLSIGFQVKAVHAPTKKHKPTGWSVRDRPQQLLLVIGRSPNSRRFPNTKCAPSKQFSPRKRPAHTHTSNQPNKNKKITPPPETQSSNAREQERARADKTNTPTDKHPESE